ncbi:WAP-type 'four-disulfide core' domain [Trinorchestia longiramus]|nr:WAP-type 'four-disulfide core' domain [Trinorchestia longiramus]
MRRGSSYLKPSVTFKMRSVWLCAALLAVAAVADDNIGKSTDEAAGAAVIAVGATRAGPQTPGGEQQTRFGPGLLGAVVNAGASLITALGGGQHYRGGGRFQGHQGGFGQQGSFGHQGQFGGLGGRPVRPGGFGNFGGRPNGFLSGGRPFAPGGFQGNINGGVRPGGFQQGGFQQGGFQQGGFQQGGFQGGFIGRPNGNFGRGGFGGQKGGSCPPVRATCPTRSNIGPTTCINDFNCVGADKCCPDTCLKSTVCKPPEKFLV